MITYYKTIQGTVREIAQPEKGCWISVHKPEEAEVEELNRIFGVNPEFINTSLDENERSHIISRDGQILMVFNIPLEKKDGERTSELFTVPVGFITMEDYLFTITYTPEGIIEDVVNAQEEHLDTKSHNEFIFTVVNDLSAQFSIHLRGVDDVISSIDLGLSQTMKNQELLKLLALQKSLVSFSSALKSTEASLEKLLRGNTIAVGQDDVELLEDTLVEIKQSIDTTHVYTEVLASTVDVVGNIISNNMNIIMKVLTSVTLVLSIPNIVFGFYGMNVNFIQNNIHVGVPLTLSLLITGLCTYFLYKHNFF